MNANRMKPLFTFLSDISQVSCNCGEEECDVSASGTLNPPASGMTVDDLDPPGIVPWEIIDANGSIVDSGDLAVSQLAWTLDVSPFSGTTGESYTLRMLPTWLIPSAPISAEDFQC